MKNKIYVPLLRNQFIDNQERLYDEIQAFVISTRDAIFLRDEDKILIIRPNKIQHINSTAFEMLFLLYHEKVHPQKVIENLSRKYKTDSYLILKDLQDLLETIYALMKEEYQYASKIQEIKFDPKSIEYPIISEIALTYKCQNKCDFCYASSPYTGDDIEEMSTADVKKVIYKIYHEAKVPTISFTGGEPTLRKDLPELIAYATSIGMRTNLITNGIKLANKKYANELAEAGLKSAQVSLESHDRDLHNSIVGFNAYDKTIAAIENLKSADVFTHTNTTICQKNKNELIEFVGFIKKKFNNPYLSMNMIIKTGIAKDNDNNEISYSDIESILVPILDECQKQDIKLFWYSPTPYCIFNPVEYNLGSKSCACVSGLVSVNPAGDILPCSSFDKGIGSLLNKSFQQIWNSDKAYYYRDNRYIPPVCQKCEYKDLCKGACPLYFENAGSFEEIENVQGKASKIKTLFWKIEKKLRVNTKGIQSPEELKCNK